MSRMVTFFRLIVESFAFGESGVWSNYSVTLETFEVFDSASWCNLAQNFKSLNVSFFVNNFTVRLIYILVIYHLK